MTDMKLEVVIIPVSNVDRAKEFYGRSGWRLDADFAFANGFRVVQFTPRGSGTSIQFGTKVTAVAPGSAQNLTWSSPGPGARDQLHCSRCRHQSRACRRSVNRKGSPRWQVQGLATRPCLMRIFRPDSRICRFGII